MKGERDGGTLMGEIKQAFGDVNDIATDLGNIIQTGANSAQAVMDVYASYKKAQMSYAPVV